MPKEEFLDLKMTKSIISVLFQLDVPALSPSLSGSNLPVHLLPPFRHQNDPPNNTGSWAFPGKVHNNIRMIKFSNMLFFIFFSPRSGNQQRFFIHLPTPNANRGHPRSMN